MYLKRLEMVGFKSFAQRTVLDFGPGMTAVVGPNGCGKSNVADAIRWVLGEQRVKVMRGSRMEDCIFNGTDTEKPLNMAEVSLTMSDCEKVLGTDFNEVTVTRRFFRSGEGQYLINKTPCRLKDVQRLFMDTGVGTDSYSLMEQGRIDRILSARPEDRRVVFEEASGITKYKADKKEALRKLEQTEVNLLRLDDIIREIKRQIISLQRQVGKAKRYKSFQEDLRVLEIFLARSELGTLDQRIETLQKEHGTLHQRHLDLREKLEDREGESAATRDNLRAIEVEIDSEMQAGARVVAELDKARERLALNGERIIELRETAARDEQEANTAAGQCEEFKSELRKLTAKRDSAAGKLVETEETLSGATTALKGIEDSVENLGRRVHSLRSTGIDIETFLAQCQNELAEQEAEERAALIRRERLSTERKELQRHVAVYEDQLEQVAARLQALEDEVKQQEQVYASRQAEQEQKRFQRRAVREGLERRRNEMSAMQARRELLKEGEKAAEGFPGGARSLLEEPRAASLNDALIIGPLAQHLVPEAEYRQPLEAVLRSLLDAVIVGAEKDALLAIMELKQSGAGSVRLLTAEGATPQGGGDDGPGERLLDHVKFSPECAVLAERLLGRVRVVPDLAVGGEIAEEDVRVTLEGEVRRGASWFERWVADEAEISPLAREQMIRGLDKDIELLARLISAEEGNLNKLATQEEDFGRQLNETGATLAESRRKLAVQQGEMHALDRERKQAREREETVAFELESLIDSGSSTTERRTVILKEMKESRERQNTVRDEMTRATAQLRDAEKERSTALNKVTEFRIQFSDQSREVEHLRQQHRACEGRISELGKLSADRAQRVQSHRRRIKELEESSADINERLVPLETQVRTHETRLVAARERRDKYNLLINDLAQQLHVLHENQAQIQEERSKIDIGLAEQRMRHQNLLNRMADDYRADEEEIRSGEVTPQTDGAPLELSEVRLKASELKRKLDEMGSVNLVAIDEHKELEQRYEFFTGQQADLTRSREQLLEMIRRINRTSTEMFMNTFNAVNGYFKEMFRRLFGGGDACLELVEGEDVLEAGVEIVARLPGKKLQTISLLSGGERTMTAVALLFALYQEKPSAFCFLDELDAALDESNIGRFVDVVKGFTLNSQFVLITHNQKTIAAADTLYGVTMAQQGISRIVSVKFHGKQLDLL